MFLKSNNLTVFDQNKKLKLGSILGTLHNINIYFTADHWDTIHQDCKVFEEAKTLDLPFDMQAAQNGQNWAPRKFTAFGKTFFEVGAIRSVNFERKF